MRDRNLSLEKLHQRALIDWVPAGQWTAATLTLRSSFRGVRLSDTVAFATAAHYLRRLEAHAFGSQGKRGRRRLYRVVVQEGSAVGHGTHLHLHAMIQVPPGRNPEDWARTCNVVWRSLDWANRENVFEPVTGDRWKHYLFKLKPEAALLDAMLFQLWHLPHAPTRTKVQY